MRRFTIIIILLSVYIFNSAASDVGDKRIKVNKNSGTATISDGISSGESISYILTARANQIMKISLSSAENNILFAIKDLKTGLFLDGATEFDDARSWEGILPSSGDYRIIVSSERGPAEFTLNITLK